VARERADVARGGRVIVTFRTRDHAGGLSSQVQQRDAISTDGGLHFGAAQTLGPAADLSSAAVSPVPCSATTRARRRRLAAASPRGFVAVWDVSRPAPGSSPFDQSAWAATVSD